MKEDVSPDGQFVRLNTLRRIVDTARRAERGVKEASYARLSRLANISGTNIQLNAAAMALGAFSFQAERIFSNQALAFSAIVIAIASMLLFVRLLGLLAKEHIGADLGVIDLGFDSKGATEEQKLEKLIKSVEEGLQPKIEKFEEDARKAFFVAYYIMIAGLVVVLASVAAPFIQTRI